MKIKGIAFDLEGTVVDVEKAHHNAHFATAAEVGVEINTDNAFRLLPHFIGGPDTQVMKEIWELSEKRVSPGELLKRKQSHYEYLLATMDVSPRPGFRGFLVKVAVDLGLPVSIGSLTSMVQAKVLLERSGVGKWIGESNIVLAEHVKNHKPKPDVFLETARRMGIDPKNQLVFEDSPHGVEAGIAAGSRVVGMPSVGVQNRPESTVPLIQAGVCRLFMDWDEINAEALIRHLSAQK